MRLLTGFLLSKTLHSTITGDESLNSRPMKRIIDPLSLHGANIILITLRHLLTIKVKKSFHP
jgi:3-phosphoshikimate 1-carboxyvinyltransferase